MKRYGTVMMMRLRDETYRELKRRAYLDDRGVSSYARKLLDELMLSEGKNGERRRA